MTSPLTITLKVSPESLRTPATIKAVEIDSRYFEAVMAGSIADATATSHFFDITKFTPAIQKAFPEAWKVLEAGRVSPDQSKPGPNMLLALLGDQRLADTLEAHPHLVHGARGDRHLFAKDAFSNVGLHCTAVSLGVMIMAKRLGVRSDDVRPLATIGLLHDANKAVELAVRSFWNALVILEEKDPQLRTKVVAALRSSHPEVASALDTKTRTVTEFYPAIIRAISALSIPLELASCMVHCGHLTSPRGILDLVERADTERVIVRAHSSTDVADLLQRHIDDCVFTPTPHLATQYQIDQTHSSFIPPSRRALLSNFGSGSHDWMRSWHAYIPTEGRIAFAETGYQADAKWSIPAGAFTQAANAAIGSLLAEMADLHREFPELPSDTRVAAFITKTLLDENFTLDSYL